MAGETYRLTELVGTSEVGVSEAITEAIKRASQTLKGLDWFEVGQIRGSIKDGQVSEYQVTMKIGFRVLMPEELRG